MSKQIQGEIHTHMGFYKMPFFLNAPLSNPPFFRAWGSNKCNSCSSKPTTTTIIRPFHISSSISMRKLSPVVVNINKICAWISPGLGCLHHWRQCLRHLKTGPMLNYLHIHCPTKQRQVAAKTNSQLPVLHDTYSLVKTSSVGDPSLESRL